MSKALTEKVEEWHRWFTWNSPPPPTLEGRVDFGQKTLRGLLSTSMAMLDEVEALVGREKWPMAAELLKQIEASVGRFMQIRSQPFGDPDRKMEFLLDMLQQVMSLQLLLARELEAAQQGQWQNRPVLWTPDALPRGMM